MSQRNTAVLILSLLGLLAIAAWQVLGGSGPAAPAGSEGIGVSGGATPLEATSPAEVANAGAETAAPVRAEVAATELRRTGVRGRVIDVRSRRTVPGVEVVALRRPPSIERLTSRFRGLFQRGLFTETYSPPEILGRAVTDQNGEFEIAGLPSGRVYLDGRSEGLFVRTPRAVRLATGEIKSGVELMGEPGGSLRGVVLAPDGLPASGASVSVRPGVNAFFGQLTQRKLCWLETSADSEGRFEILGVPTGPGYTVAAAHPLMSLEEVYGVEIEEGRTTQLTVQGQSGAAILGRVADPDGAPVAGAQIGMVYMDMSRALLSADGRQEPWTTDEDGSFRIDRIAAGRIALAAMAEGLAPSGVHQLTVVDGGVYDEVELVLGGGVEFAGLVVDENDRPLPGALVELRPFERPDDPDVIQMALKIRNLQVETAADGSFAVQGLSGERLIVQASKAGYVSEIRTGVRLDEHPRIQLVRAATVRGVVAEVDGSPVTRFSVQTRSRAPRPESDDAAADDPDDEQRPWRRRGRGGMDRARTMRVREGGQPGGRAMMGMGGGDWEEVNSADGTFDLSGVPPGRIRVRVRAEGYLSPSDQNIELAGGAASEVLRFEVQPGIEVRGTVVDADTGVGVPDAQVTAHRSRDRGERGGFALNIDLEDFDFLGLASQGGESIYTDSQGRFVVPGLSAGQYRFTARHPDRAKASAKDVEIQAGATLPELRIELSAGGAIEGQVTGAGGLPLGSAVVAALSISAGALKSGSTDAAGYYKIEGLAPGQYVVFKSRMDERSSNLGFDLLGNLRLKSVTVRPGQVARLDIHDAGEGTVRVTGVVRDGGQPVARAMVGALSSDADGILGMGIRAQPTDEKGRFELIGMKPGTYLFQVSRFRDRPQQANLSVEIPEGVGEYRVDLELPQSSIEGIVQDAGGQPVAGIRVQAGIEEGGAEVGGLLGLMLTNSVARARTDDSGRFVLKGVAPGVYRLTASGKERRQRGDDPKYGDASQGGLSIDGKLPLQGIVLTLPLAGQITGTVVDGNGAPLPRASVHYQREDEAKAERSQPLADLFGMQMRPARTDEQGRFTLDYVSPGTYSVRAEVDDLAPGVVEDVSVVEAGTADVRIQIVRGATLRVRVTNIDGSMLPAARVTVLDGTGKPLARNVSVLSVFRRLMKSEQKKDDSGWYEVGKVPPDTYTVIVKEEGQPEISVSKQLRDGELVEWSIDMTAELEASGRGKK